MSEFWSKKVQSSELLYYSRLEKFNDENKNLWFRLLHVRKNLKILEVGCGGGLFTNMIKKYYPSCEVYGIDLDENHIKFARNECKKQNLKVNYQVADIKNLPFKDENFDLVFSHTVVEHLPFDDFIKEQKRVLKTGGKLVIMRVDMIKKNDQPFMYLEDEVNSVYGQMVFGDRPKVGSYLEEPSLTMQKLNKYRFKNIKFNYDRILYYMPDCAENKKIALNQIERNYKVKLYFALSSLDNAQNGEKLREKLLNLLKKQYEKRVEIYNSGEKIFDFQSSLLITISAKK